MKIELPARVKHAGYLFVLVTGGRKYSDQYTLCDALDRIEELCDRAQLHMTVVQGGATGADKIARQWAWDNSKRCISERANWRDLTQPDAVIRTGRTGAKYDARAGFRRNQRMIDKHQPDICVAAPGGNGTADMVDRCHAAGIPVCGITTPPTSPAR
jgi:hypothetical protein